MDPTRDEAILRAVEQLILERGSVDFAITEVVSRARVSTATIYRRWPTREALVLDTMGRLFGDSHQADLGDAYAETLALLQLRHDAMSSPLYLACIPMVFGETIRQSHFAVRFIERNLSPLRSEAAEVYRRAVDRGQFADTIDPEIFVDLVVGPVLRRLIETGAPLAPAFLEQVSRTVVDGLAVRSSASDRSSTAAKPASER